MKIRSYESGDEAGFQILDRLVEIHPWNRRNLENWQWKYKGANPAGDALIVVADHNGDMAAHFAAIPIWYWIDGHRVRGSHSIAMMVKPEWQNRGLIKFVADQLIKELIAQKISFTYGYPNDNAYELHIHHLAYEDVSMQTLIGRRMDGMPDIEQYRFPASLTFAPINTFSEETDRLWETVRSHLRVSVERSSAFLNWRYIARPDVSYFAYGAYDDGRLIGYTVMKLYRKDGTLRGHFVDLFTSPTEKEYGRFIVQRGLGFFKEKGCHEVNLWMQGSPYFQEILGEYRFSVVSARPMICRFNVDRDNYKSILTKQNWYFTMGDTLEIY